MPATIRTDDDAKDFVTAAHFSLEKVQQLLAADPALLDVAYLWREDDPETAIQAAAHMGNHPIAEYLLAQGAPLAIYTAAMLGRVDDVRQMLDADASRTRQRGAHGFTLMWHVALSGHEDLATLVYDRGAREGFSHALHAAISQGHAGMVDWLLHHGADDLMIQDFRGRTPLQAALEAGHESIAGMLRHHGAREQDVQE